MSQVKFDTVRTTAFGAISGTYAFVGAAYTHSLKLVHIINNTDGDMILSLDGATDQIFVPAASFVLYDLSTNSPPVSVNDTFELPRGTRFSIKQSTAPTLGAVWINAIYSSGE